MLKGGAAYRNGTDWSPAAPLHDPNEPTDMLYATKSDERPIGDCMFLLSCSHLILSKCALEVFNGFTLCPSILWIPLTVQDQKGQFIDQYYVVDTPRAKRHYVLDLANSEVTYYPETDVIWKILKWHLDADALPCFDLFYTAHHRWICSERLMTAVEDSRLTSFCFERIWEG